MMKNLLTILLAFCITSLTTAQVYIDEFDDGDQSNVFYNNGYSGSEADGEWTITGDGSGGAFDIFGYNVVDDAGAPISIDLTGNNKVYVRAKASNLGTQLRMDAIDADGYATTLAGFTKTCVNDYTVFEFDFSGNYSDGGYGGTPCDASTAPCDVDGTRITNFFFFVNPGQGSWAGSVVIDYISVGLEPDGQVASSVWQDHFDNIESLGYMGTGSTLVNSVGNSLWSITGDGTNGPWDPVNILMGNPETGDTIDVSVAEGNDKVFIRMRTDVPNTSIRLDLMDINDMATTAGSITKIISDEWATYEFNFAGSYQDLAYGGTGCTAGPCPVDAERIANMILFVNPGVEAFVGQVDIEYISVGTALEGGAGGEGVLVYGDHFSSDSGLIGTGGAFELEVNNSTLSITGLGVDAPFAAVSYTCYDDTGGIAVDATGNNKLFIKARSSVANTRLRVDLQDSEGYVTTIPSFTRVIDEEYSVIELDFAASYVDGGYGGTPCDAGPCPVDGTMITGLLFYPNPADGMFEGVIDIDYVSFGAPMGEDVIRYSDHFDNEDASQFSDAGGFTVEETGTELTITGDGTAGPYSAFNYTAHDQASGEQLTLDLTSNNKFYVKAKSTVDGTPLRIDLVDMPGFATTEPATIRNIGLEYSVLQFDFSGTYTDGGYGGTACDTGPCPVDGTTIQNFLFYIDPDNGGFAGTVTIDWVSTIDPLETITVNEGPLGVDDYADEFIDNTLDFTTGVDGLTTVAEDGQLKVIGDGTSGPWTPVSYEMHDGTDTLLVNAVNNDNKLYVRARSTVADLPLRIDVQDKDLFVSSLASLQNLVGTEFSTLEYDYSGNYQDGGFGGTPCTTGPCPVDGQRIQFLQYFLDPGIGMFDGELHIDWISFGEPLTVNVFETELIDGAKIYPNPASEEMYLEMDTKLNGVVIASIMGMNGKIVQTTDLGNFTAGNNSMKISINGLATGMYFLNVSIDDQAAFYTKIFID